MVWRARLNTPISNYSSSPPSLHPLCISTFLLFSIPCLWLAFAHACTRAEIIDDPPGTPKKVFITVSEKVVGCLDREHNILQLEDLAGFEKVVTDPKDPHLIGYVTTLSPPLIRFVFC